ncbi:retrovirus-related Pol polyprotein from type-1 retrotransposable element R2 [Elysia marginata]|uniref:Retrovirus-related Pol polyprotein from type-1 retrotransposable element R2 n=1 Tax=Elysia marginata TaxID=1093978 RepID=A0AAV4JNF3_9GAST|nr:retrovirus-related Pol polyprotein from type-1 retrotransposable element R2 [Elysia marginata]
MSVINTHFKQPKRRLYTWTSPGDVTRNQIDYLAINSRFKNAVSKCKTYPGADIGSDHAPVIMKINIKLKIPRRTSTKAAKYDVSQLKNEELQKKYAVEKAAVRVEEETSNFQNIKRGVRQECVLTPDLFSLYSEMIMRQIEEMKGLKIGGHNINNIRYADDTVLTADSEEKLQELLNKVVEESKNKGLELNSKKTESMIITRKTSIPKCGMKIEENTIKQANSFKYLGTQITSDGRNHQEIKSRIAQAKASFQ